MLPKLSRFERRFAKAEAAGAIPAGSTIPLVLESDPAQSAGAVLKTEGAALSAWGASPPLSAIFFIITIYHHVV